MPAKKNVSSPLHLLQQLSSSLVEHLEKACADAQKETQGILAKLEKQRGKTRDKLIRTRAKLDEAGAAGKAKTQIKIRARIDELEDTVALLDARQRETLAYLADLQRDTDRSLKLAEGIRRVEAAAAKAVAVPVTKTASKVAPARARSPRQTPHAAVTIASIEAAPVPAAAAAKPRVRSRGAATPAPVKSLNGEVTPASVKKPVPRKPAARKPAGTNQASVSSS